MKNEKKEKAENDKNEKCRPHFEMRKLKTTKKKMFTSKKEPVCISLSKKTFTINGFRKKIKKKTG